MKQWVKISFRIYLWAWSIQHASAPFSGVKSQLCCICGKWNNYNYVVCAGASLKTILLFLIKAAPRESRRERAHKDWAFRTIRHHYSIKTNVCSPNTSYKMKCKVFNPLSHFSSVCWYLYLNTHEYIYFGFLFVFTHCFCRRKRLNKILEWPVSA